MITCSSVKIGLVVLVENMESLQTNWRQQIRKAQLSFQLLKGGLYYESKWTYDNTNQEVLSKTQIRSYQS